MGGDLRHDRPEHHPRPRWCGIWALTSTGTPTQAFARNLISAASVVDEGETYNLGMWWYSVAGFANARISVDWYDAGGAYLSTGTTLQAISAADVGVCQR